MVRSKTLIAFTLSFLTASLSSLGDGGTAAASALSTSASTRRIRASGSAAAAFASQRPSVADASAMLAARLDADAEAAGIAVAPQCADAPVAVHMEGGLGNHLFGAAFGVALSMRRARSTRQLTLIRAQPEHPRAAQTIRLHGTLLAAFNMSHWADEYLASRPPGRNEPVARISMTDLPGCGLDPARLAGWAAAPCGTLQIASGLFQNTGYFAGAHDLLRALFAVPPAIEREFIGRFGVFSDSGEGGAPPKYWAIHVRRGDYVNLGDILLPLEYFKEAAALMMTSAAAGSQAPPISILIFSDDVEWTREQRVFTDLTGAIFVDEADPLKAFYFLVLAAEGGIVCSNSTFCWWAAFLSAARREAYNERLAIFPERWALGQSLSGVFGDEDCGAGLCLPYMTLMYGF